MRTVFQTPPPPAPPAGDFEIRDGFSLISKLDEFRSAINRDDQRIRMWFLTRYFAWPVEWRLVANAESRRSYVIGVRCDVMRIARASQCDT